MRAKRQLRTCERKEFKFKRLSQRMTKNISNLTKIFEQKKANIQKQAKAWQTQSQSIFLNKAGLGENCVGQNNMFGGFNNFIYNGMLSMLTKQGIPKLDKNGKQTHTVKLPDTKFQQMFAEYHQNMGKFIPAEKPADTKQFKNYTNEEVQMFMQAMYHAQGAQQQAQTWVNQQTTQCNLNISIWEEAQLARLEAEQDSVIAPLEYEQDMLEIDSTANKTLLEMAKQKVEELKSEVSEEIKQDGLSFKLA